MGMEGVKNGTSDSSPAAARTQYMASPTEMSTDMHMVGAMYGLTDKTTLTLMGSYLDRSMIIERPNGTTFKRQTRGFGDTKVGAITEVFSSDKSTKRVRNTDAVYVNTVLSTPTGEHDARDAGNVTGYAMRTGTGTFDPTLGLTYVGKRRGYSFGAQALGTFRLYDNDDDFRFGNLYQATMWTQARLNDAFSASLSVRGFRQERVKGSDPATNAGMAFVFDPAAQEREGVDIGAGLNFIVPTGALKGQRFALEATAPVYERIKGFGLERDYRLTAGWQYAF